MFSLLILVLGFALLILGADKFVTGASALASRLGVPTLLVGLTVVAFGTSAPELAVSISAGLSGANEIVIGNVLGSNLFNLLVIAGISAILHPLIIHRDLLCRDWLFTLLATALVGLLVSLDGTLSRLDGLLLLAVFTLTLALQIIPALRHPPQENEDTPTTLSFPKIALYILGGLTAIVMGGNFAVDGAVAIAKILGLSETFIGLTIVAIGTSLPELVTSVVATRRGEYSIAMGNIIGSNLFNLLFILGVSATITPIAVLPTAILDCLLLFAISTLLYLPALCNQFKRPLGVVMVCSYIGYTIWILLR